MKIEIQNLEHIYPTGEKALDGVSFTLDNNERVAIIGQNGAGKTTIVKHFNGILRPTAGKVLLDGVDIEAKSTPEWAARVGYVYQNPDDQLFLDSVRDEFQFGAKQIGMRTERIEQLLVEVAELVGLSDKLDVNPFDLTQTEKKFCAIGSIVMMDPEVLIFDEPTMGQDVVGNDRLAHIIEVLHNQGKMCVTISHDMKFVVRCFDRVIVMCHGHKLLDGPTREVFSQIDTLKESFVVPPPITRIGQALGFKKTVLTLDELVEEFSKERAK